MSQIKLLLDIASDLKHLSESVEEYAKSVVQNEKLVPGEFEQIYPITEEDNTFSTAEPEEAPAPQKTITLEQIRGLAAAKAQSGLRKEVKALVAKYGAASLSVLPQDKFPAFLAELEAM